MIARRTTFPNEKASIRPARHAVVDFAANWFCGEALQDIEVGIGEALAYCVDHPGTFDGSFAVNYTFDGRSLLIDIRPGGEKSAPIFDDFREPAQDGYGDPLMRRVMDRVEYLDRGARLMLLKQRLYSDN